VTAVATGRDPASHTPCLQRLSEGFLALEYDLATIRLLVQPRVQPEVLQNVEDTKYLRRDYNRHCGAVACLAYTPSLVVQKVLNLRVLWRVLLSEDIGCRNPSASPTTDQQRTRNTPLRLTDDVVVHVAQ
jgi:hypothetical protein